MNSINRRYITQDYLLYIIFFITQIHTVCLVSINGEASRVKSSKKNVEKKLEKKF